MCAAALLLSNGALAALEILSARYGPMRSSRINKLRCTKEGATPTVPACIIEKSVPRIADANAQASSAGLGRCRGAESGPRNAEAPAQASSAGPGNCRVQ